MQAFVTLFQQLYFKKEGLMERRLALSPTAFLSLQWVDFINNFIIFFTYSNDPKHKIASHYCNGMNVLRHVIEACGENKNVSKIHPLK